MDMTAKISMVATTMTTARYMSDMGLSTMNCPMMRVVKLGPTDVAMVTRAPISPVISKYCSSQRSPVAKTDALPKPKTPEAI